MDRSLLGSCGTLSCHHLESPSPFSSTSFLSIPGPLSHQAGMPAPLSLFLECCMSCDEGHVFLSRKQGEIYGRHGMEYSHCQWRISFTIKQPFSHHHQHYHHLHHLLFSLSSWLILWVDHLIQRTCLRGSVGNWLYWVNKSHGLLIQVVKPNLVSSQVCNWYQHKLLHILLSILVAASPGPWGAGILSLIT